MGLIEHLFCAPLQGIKKQKKESERIQVMFVELKTESNWQMVVPSLKEKKVHLRNRDTIKTVCNTVSIARSVVSDSLWSHRL